MADAPSSDAGASSSAASSLAKSPAAPRTKKARRSKPSSEPYEPSMTIALLVYWVLPVLLFAIGSRFVVYTGPAVQPLGPSKPVTINPGQLHSPPTPAPPKKDGRKSTAMPTLLSNKPTSYQEAIQKITKRRLDWTTTEDDPMEGYMSGQKVKSSPKDKVSKPPSRKPTAGDGSASSPSSSPAKSNSRFPQTDSPRGASKDPIRLKHLQEIATLRERFRADPDDMLKALYLADALRIFDVQYHDGGTAQQEAIETYQDAIRKAVHQRMEQLERGEETSRNLAGFVDLNEELTMDYTTRSIDGLLCAMYCALGKTYFMANMFEKAVESYDKALELEPLYLDAVSSRGSARIILGQYPEAAQDFVTVLETDERRRFQDVFTGLARVLQAKESAYPGGWEKITTLLDDLIPKLEHQVLVLDHQEAVSLIRNSLNRFYHVFFLYHDVKTKDTNAAWEMLSKSYEHKMAALAPWNKGFEMQKVASTKMIFHKGFWPEGGGSDTPVPIFVIGFVRSGSTLLERVLDAHPQIVGTGENSVFNGQLDQIRNKIVEASMLGDTVKLNDVIVGLAEEVVDEMRARWRMVASGGAGSIDGQPEPRRFVDKMLTNYYNVGFIHMLFPKALILHVAREPMDTIFSAYKHEFPSGPLDYTSFFPSLAEFYHGYRDLMEHWDRELPGRVTHVRYEDMVNDMPGVARKIIEATGLEWDDGVLEFHKKKQAVNTLSTTQVRKGVYKDSMQSWRRYETHLQPLVDLIGPRTTYDLKTSFAGYTAPSPEDAQVGSSVEVKEEQEPQPVARYYPVEAEIGATGEIQYNDGEIDSSADETAQEAEESVEVSDEGSS